MRARVLIQTTLTGALLALTLTGCGVAIGDSWDGTETFRGLSIDGEPKVGSELTLAVKLGQGYTVPVRVACYYEDGDKLTDDQKKLAFPERAKLIGETVLPAARDQRPSKDAPGQTFTFRFSVAEPGEYFVACLTPAAMDNGWGKPLRIRK